jgi:hypothetical protein
VETRVGHRRAAVVAWLILPSLLPVFFCPTFFCHPALVHSILVPAVPRWVFPGSSSSPFSRDSRVPKKLPKIFPKPPDFSPAFRPKLQLGNWGDKR